MTIITGRNFMNTIGRLTEEKDLDFIFKSIKTDEHYTIPKNIFPTPPAEYVSFSVSDNNYSDIHNVFFYKSIPTKEIILEETFNDHPILFLEPFSIVSHDSMEDAKLSFEEFFTSSSCNFVQKIKYTESKDSLEYTVSGEIGVYYLEGQASDELATKFNQRFNESIDFIRANLDEELLILNNVKTVQETSKKVLCFIFPLIVLMIFLSVFFK